MVRQELQQRTVSYWSLDLMDKVVKEVLSEAADALFKMLEEDSIGVHPAWITLSKIDYIINREKRASNINETVLLRHTKFTDRRGVYRCNPKAQDHTRSVGSIQK